MNAWRCFWGKDYSPVISVDSADGIRARLISGLNYLNTTYPTEGWGQFLLNSDGVLWNTVCVSGHSQGAGMASIIAYWFPVDRGVFFATGGDISEATHNVALWMEGPSATPPARKYAFTHREDELFWGVFNSAPEIWDTLGLFQYGQYINFDTLSGNYYGRHTFTSTDTISSTSLIIYHNCVVVDDATPLVGSAPYYLPLWQYMLTDTIADTTATTGITPVTKQATFTLYPNPASNQLYISLPNLTEESILTITDLTGKLLLQKTLNPNGTTVVNTSQLAPGLYFASVNGVTQKVCIAR